MRDLYKRQLKLVLTVLETVLQDERLALKGGTAINLFYRDFPRYSVDIDLNYLPLQDRKTTFLSIHTILAKISRDLTKDYGLKVIHSKPLQSMNESRLIVSNKQVTIKIEPNYILRGSVFSPSVIPIHPRAGREFEMDVRVQCLHKADLYGSKICAALDRQHPRDLFDVKYLLDREGITGNIKSAFIFYLLSHPRPINEILQPRWKALDTVYDIEFRDMTTKEITLDEMNKTRDQLLRNILSSLDEMDREFLLSFVSNSPDWTLKSYQQFRDYPSVKWKLFNQKRMEKKKQEEYIKKMKDIL